MIEASEDDIPTQSTLSQALSTQQESLSQNESLSVESSSRQAASLHSLSRAISPPPTRKQRAVVSSPFKLTRIKDLPDSENVDTVRLEDLLGDPLITECWNFNYLHDIPWVLSKFHPSTRLTVLLHIVHGFWKREDRNRIAFEVYSLISQFFYGSKTDRQEICRSKK